LCLERKVVSEFICFHSLLENTRYLQELLPAIPVRETVVVDLEPSVEQKERSRR
jgi:hypothetical protein